MAHANNTLNWHRIGMPIAVQTEIIICLETMDLTLGIQARLGRHSCGTHFLMKLYSCIAHCSMHNREPARQRFTK